VRTVHDVMWVDGAPVAYDVNNKEHYHQPICPWCGQDIGKRFNANVVTPTMGELYLHLFRTTARHMKQCAQRQSREMAVIAKVRAS
jgi:hypothetical protein